MGWSPSLWNVDGLKKLAKSFEVGQFHLSPIPKGQVIFLPGLVYISHLGPPFISSPPERRVALMFQTASTILISGSES